MLSDDESVKGTLRKGQSTATTKKQKNRAPFGSAVPRFGKITQHPCLDRTGLFVKRPPACDPCRYSPQSMHEVYRVNKNIASTKDPWRYKAELEDWSKNLGYRNQWILERRRWQFSLLGPAWRKLRREKKYEPACKNLSFGRTVRFRPSKNRNPGPGTYYKAEPFKAPYGPHSKRPTLEREEACRFKDTCPRWSLAPDRYVIVDKDNIENKSKKLVSLRGPYDLFTGKRDGTTIKNHFNDSLRCAAATWPLALKGSFEEYKKTQLGKFNKTGRDIPYRGRLPLVDMSMSYKRPSDPCAASYSIDGGPRVFKKNMYGFNSSYDRPPGYVRVVVWPGVGRYTIGKRLCGDGIEGHGHKHAFLSKIKRTIGAVIPEPMNSF